MQRRTFLARGLGAVGAASLAAGCLERSGDDSNEASGDGGGNGDGAADSDDGTGPEITITAGETPDASATRAGLAPDSRDVEIPEWSVEDFERIDVRGVPVPLIPIDVAYPLYAQQEARFVDARSQRQYDASHVEGAVLSPAADGFAEDDPTDAWHETERVVTYCGCPHHLSSSRAASMLASGHEAVFALDEGFFEWRDREYPLASASGMVSFGAERTIRGSTDPAFAGEFAWVRHEPTDQREPATIAADGSFAITFRFVDVGPADTLVVETPGWTRRGTVAELVDGQSR